MGRLLAQQGGEPWLIEQHLLARRFPEGADLLFLAPGCKGPLPEGEGQHRFEMRGLGIAAASFPLAYRFSGDPQQLSRQIPVGRLGRPEEVADLAIAVLGNPYLTNQVISIDGGMYPR